jgi:hypothetical protein
MTWTEGTLKICDGIIISSGYSGICTFIILLIVLILYLIFICWTFKLALDTLAEANERIQNYGKKRDI